MPEPFDAIASLPSLAISQVAAKRGLPLAACFILLVCGSAHAAGRDSLQAAEIARAEWSATGGRAWNAAAGVVFEGTVTEGGAPEPFVETIDLRTGHFRMIRGSSSRRWWTGYDGKPWLAGNGIVNTVDLPALLADARSQAFVLRAGWRTSGDSRITGLERSADSAVVHYLPLDASEAAVTFDTRTHRVSRAVIDGEEGPVMTTYEGWRRVGPVWFAFRQVRTDDVGEVTTIAIDRARVLGAVPADSLARPARSPHGHLVSGAAAHVPFRYLGSHILVPVSFNGVGADVIFDTGAANYVAPVAASRFGLEVTGGLNLSGVGESSTTGGFARVKTIALGAAELRDEDIVVAPVPWPIPAGQEATTPIGFVGYEFLSEFRTTIDYPAQTLTLTPFVSVETRSAHATTIPFCTDEHTVYVEADVEGHRGWFRLDTGDGGTVTLFPAFASAHHLGTTTGEQSAGGGGVGGGVKSSSLTLPEFRLGGATFHDLPARLSRNKAGAFASRSLAGNLGGGLLRCFRITLDYRARTATFEADPDRLSDCVGTKKP